MDQAYYRGGKDLTPRQNEVKIDPATGLVQPTRGISVSTDSGKVRRFGGAYRVKSIPGDLEIVQQGRDRHHHELRPRQKMTLDRYRELLQQVELEQAPTS